MNALYVEVSAPVPIPIGVAHLLGRVTGTIRTGTVLDQLVLLPRQGMLLVQLVL